MFNFFRKFSSSKKLSKSSRFEYSLSRLFSVQPELDSATQKNIKKRILNRILAERGEFKNAEVLDQKLAGKQIEQVKNSAGVVDFLAAIAEAFLNLPKILPQISWRKEVRGNFEKREAFLFSGIFRQATAFAMLAVVVGGIFLTSFVSQTRTAVAQLSVESGVVKIREAQSTFFEPVKKVATIRLGDTIRVEADSIAELSFYDASKLLLTAKTEVLITEFKPDFISREKSEVTIALLSGSLQAEVAKADSSFEVETSTGSVEAQNAKFSVTVNPETGSTKIQTSEDVVAVKSAKSSEAVALVAGESVVFSEEEILFVEVAADIVKTIELLLPSLGKLQTELEFAKIRSFDALIASQNGDDSIARKIRASIEEKLEQLLLESGIPKFEGGKIETLGIFLRKNYPEGPGREIALKNLNQIAAVGEILNYYFVAPQKLRGVPAFEILAKENYTPPGRLRNLFAALRAGELAHTEIKPLVEKLSGELAIELAGNLSGADSEKRVNELLAGMQEQPIFLPALAKFESIAPRAARDLILNKILRLEETIQKYAGG